jgi:hypothetical protein
MTPQRKELLARRSLIAKTAMGFLLQMEMKALAEV